jgi:hypothetical protein
MATALLPRQSDRTDPPSLVAIAVAAHRTGDRTLERAAKRELEQTHGIALRFTRKCEAGR